MEDKIKRESKSFLEKLFKKYDKLETGAVTSEDMIKIVMTTVPDFNKEIETEELTELMQTHAKSTKYTVHNKTTNQFEMKFQQNTLDFPSALAIIVHFLKKREKGSNAFAGKGLLRVHDFPDTHRELLVGHSSSVKKRLF